MKKRKKSSGGGANWMDTYGDMVTLLLCFFVLLYSMSTISEENWKALVMSFNPEAAESIRETSGNNGPSADPGGESGGMNQGEIDQMMDELYMKIAGFVEEKGEENDISFFRESGKIFISFKDTVFFPPDSPVLKEESKPVLDSISEMLSESRDAIDEVRVLGHTAQGDPNRPNRVRVDRTLASQRATNVVIYIQEKDAIDPGRLISEGIGQWRPVAPNDSSENRAKNRRVEMIISGRDIKNELQDGISEFESE